MQCSRGSQIGVSTHGVITGCLSVSTLPAATDPTLNPTKGPKNNPAKLPTDGNQSIYALFAQIFRAAIDTVSSKEPVRFLSRYDKSAANIAESRIWATIGQTPWAHPYSPWYHRFVDFPFQALRAASRLGEYAIMDRGTWCAVEPEVRNAMAIFVSPIVLTSATMFPFHTRLRRHANESHRDYNRQLAQTPEKTIR